METMMPLEVNQSQLRRSMRASFNAIARAMKNLDEIMQADPDTISGVTIGDMRDEVELITKSFHEFAAYKNVLMTHLESRAALAEAAP